MLRATRIPLAFRATVPLKLWAAEEGDPGAPDTTFKNLKPGRVLRLWRQIRQRAWMMWTLDEETGAPLMEAFTGLQRLEQVSYSSSSAYGMVPGSYCDPLLYNTKNTSPFRWHLTHTAADIIGHWYVDTEDLYRLKEWKPKTDNPMEYPPRPPQMTLLWDESVDANGNRTFRYKYKYDNMGPFGLGDPHPKYPFGHLYMSDGPMANGAPEAYGFKQGHMLRCDDEEEEVLRRVMFEEDKEWEMIKRTEIIQEPWSYPGKIRSEDFEGAVDRAKERFRKQVKAGKETDPSEDPEYDLVQSGEYVEPRDSPRAEWRHLWTSNTGGKNEYQVTFNEGFTTEQQENVPPIHPQSHYEKVPKTAPWEKFEKHDHGDAGHNAGDSKSGEHHTSSSSSSSHDDSGNKGGDGKGH